MKGKKAAGKKANPNSPFWKGEKEGDSIEGKFMHFERTTFNKGKADERKAMIVVLNVAGKVKKVTLGAVLHRLFASIYTKMKPGQNVAILFEGKRKRTSIYTLNVAGKAVEDTYQSKPATKEDLKEGFAE